jgi:hypothetical protein
MTQASSTAILRKSDAADMKERAGYTETERSTPVLGKIRNVIGARAWRNTAARLSRLGVLSICERLCEAYGETLADVLGSRRFANLVRVRHHIWSLVMWTCDLSLSATARLFGMDRDAIRNGLASHEARITRECFS